MFKKTRDLLGRLVARCGVPWCEPRTPNHEALVFLEHCVRWCFFIVYQLQNVMKVSIISIIGIIVSPFLYYFNVLSLFETIVIFLLCLILDEITYLRTIIWLVTYTQRTWLCIVQGWTAKMYKPWIKYLICVKPK